MAKNISNKGLTNAAQHATMVHMTERTAPMLPTGDRTSVPRLALSQQAAASLDKSAGVCSPSLIWQRLNLSRAGKHYRGFSRDKSRLGLTNLFAGVKSQSRQQMLLCCPLPKSLGSARRYQPSNARSLSLAASSPPA